MYEPVIPPVVMDAHPSTVMAFWSKVDQDGPVKVDALGQCWEWKGTLNAPGKHGAARYGTYQQNKKHWLAHRLAYSMAKGPIPDGLTIDHLCRNVVCVRPEHLEAVTIQENIARGTRANQTHCKRGHPLFGPNLALRGKNRHRACRTCANWHRRKYPDYRRKSLEGRSP